MVWAGELNGRVTLGPTTKLGASFTAGPWQLAISPETGALVQALHAPSGRVLADQDHLLAVYEPFRGTTVKPSLVIPPLAPAPVDPVAAAEPDPAPPA